MLFALLDLLDCREIQRSDHNIENISSFLIDSYFREFISEPCNLLLEDETHPTRYHGYTTEYGLENQPTPSVAKGSPKPVLRMDLRKM